MLDYIHIRSFLIHNVPGILDNLSARKQNRQNQSDDLFSDAPETTNQSSFWNYEYPLIAKRKILQEEKSSLGLYVSGNPLEEYEPLLLFLKEKLKIKNLYLIVLEKLRKIFTRNNQMMLALDITTLDGDLEGVVFPSKALEFSPIFEEKKLYWVVGKISERKKKTQKDTEKGEIKEYVELPKLIIDGVSEISQGPKKALQRAHIDYTESMEKSLQDLNFEQITLDSDTIPEEIKKLEIKKAKGSLSADLVVKQTNTVKTKKNKPKENQPFIQDIQAVELIRIPKDFGLQKLKELRNKLKRDPFSGALAIILEIETANTWKKVKHTHWISQEDYQKYQLDKYSS